jgi:nucleoside-diphosphate-sugar epimerase
MNKKTVIVTGGAGFLGSHLVPALIKQDYNVVVIDNLVNGKKENVPKDIWHCTADIRNREDVMTFFRSVAEKNGGVDGVFHLAALPRVQYSIDYPREARSVNVEGLENVFEAAAAIKARRLVYSASSSAYGDQEELPFREDMKPNPMSPYANHKLYGEHVARTYALHYGLQTVSLRYFNIYGPGADPNGPYAQAGIKFVHLRSQGKPLTIFGDGNQTRDIVHVRDVARANIAALQSLLVGEGEVINIGSGKNTSVLELARMIGGKIVHLPARKEPKHTLASISKAEAYLNWRPEVSREEGIAELKKIHGIE